MSDDTVRDYLEAGKRLEDGGNVGQWSARNSTSGAPPHVVALATIDGRRHTAFVAVCNCAGQPNAENASFIADARERLPRYRRAIEAALELQQKRAILHATGESGYAKGYLHALADLEIALERALMGEEKADA